jgi:hypothetical protein
MSKFKPGDLVLILNDPDCPSNCFKTGELAFRVHEDQPVLNQEGGLFWYSAAGWCVRGEGLAVRIKNHEDYVLVSDGPVFNDEAFVEEKYLMHLRGDFEPESESELIGVAA